VLKRKQLIRRPYRTECPEGTKDNSPYGPSERSEAESTAFSAKISLIPPGDPPE